MSENVILNNLDHPQILEEVYRSNPDKFEVDLAEALSQRKDSETLRVWDARLSFVSPDEPSKVSVLFIVFLCLLAGFFTKLPSIFPIDGDWYYPRFVPLITVTAIIIYFFKTSPNTSTLKFTFSAIVGCIVFLIMLPHSNDSASITMALLHLPLFVFSLLAISFMSNTWNSVKARLDFIRYSGEMGIYTVLILLGGIVLTGITLSLFNLIDLSIEEWYFEYVVVLGLVSSPLVATYLFDSIQRRQSKFAPILSNVFSPLFLITVIVYLVATFYQGKSPFTDRDFLISFNGLLLVILALTIFSISGKKSSTRIALSDYINVALVSATLIVDIIALLAILFRWAEYGMTVNRIVVTGANLLIFIHLVLLGTRYIDRLRLRSGINKLESTIAMYLPVYTVWSLFVSVIIPLVFWFE